MTGLLVAVGLLLVVGLAGFLAGVLFADRLWRKRAMSGLHQIADRLDVPDPDDEREPAPASRGVAPRGLVVPDLAEHDRRAQAGRPLVIVETTPAQDLPEAEPGVQPSGMRTWRGLPPGERDPRFPSIHPAVWNATGTPAEQRVYDIPTAFWDDVANIHVDGSDMSP